MQQMARKQYEKTRYPGVFRVIGEPHLFRLFDTWTDLRTGKERQRERLFRTERPEDALGELARMKAGREATAPASRLRVRDCAMTWLADRRPALGTKTHEVYKGQVAHIIAGLGDFYVDALDRQAVQDWINEAQAPGARTDDAGYSPETCRGWLRRLATMAIDLGWPADVTRRITLGAAPDRGPNRLAPEQLAAVLRAYRSIDPDTFALVAILAITGVRFSVASALRWEDIDEAEDVLLFRRKQVNGEVSPISAKKPAPEDVPVTPEVLAILRAHRAHLVATQCPGVESGFCFPYRATGELVRQPGYLDPMWSAAKEAAKVTERVTIHGLRRSHGRILKRKEIDAITRRSFTAHGDERIQGHYEGVGRDERRAAIAVVVGEIFPKTLDETLDAEAENKNAG